MKAALKILFNKYVLSMVFLLAWLVFFDETDFFTQQERLSYLNKLNKKKQYYTAEIAIAKQDLSQLENNDEAVEKFARETYLMKKDGEDIFIIETTK